MWRTKFLGIGRRRTIGRRERNQVFVRCAESGSVKIELGPDMYSTAASAGER